MSVENMDIETMTEVWNSWAEINRQKDAEIRKLKEANSGSVINLRLKILKEENKILKENVKDLQGQLQNSYKKNKELEDKNHQKVVILEKLLEGISDGKLQTKVKEN